ncbi:MAG: phosphatase PAP2 family protein [Lachnospiraceae bacterium]|nr:phosphatase PAP2 family protein [Lachnospiraceae bacterium]MDD7628091.1 phosphatase PAP2 family protein [Lachnospiraceae bacterium]MDY4119874.1 phosphatase PAP2 family protein [Lachnospiraceae bacterium]
MKKRNQKNFGITVCLLVTFVLWTAAISCLDVKPIGPDGSVVGFATLNGFFHNLTGVHMLLYTITDWLGLVPLCFVLGFAVLGFLQMIKRRSLLKVDYSILVLGGFYIIVMASYVFFEVFVINYRPVLIEGYLEASYPSSTTLLVMCVMPTAMMQFHERIRSGMLRKSIDCVLIAFTGFMVVGRLLSGVHWLTDIVGGALLSAGLIMLYYSVENIKLQKG